MGIRVLSLFNGMSCGHIALKRGGITVKEYISSEIDKSAIKVTQYHDTDTFQIGNVELVSYKNGILYYEEPVTKIMKQKYVGRIHIVIAGSPCQDFSRANPNGEGLKGEKSGLFYEFLRILKEVKPKYFLLENVVMSDHDRDIITSELGVSPLKLNSNLVSAQNRDRLYWTDIEGVTIPQDKKLVFKDIAHNGVHKFLSTEDVQKKNIKETKYIKSTGVVQWDATGGGHNSQWDRAYFQTMKTGTLSKTGAYNMNIVVDYSKDSYRKIHIIEAEELQNVKPNYTNVPGVTERQRFAMLGNGWTIDIITHIFSFMNLNYLYSEDEEMKKETA